MRRIAMCIPVLCCLPFVAQQSAARDDVTKDNSEEWQEGSVWGGIMKIQWSSGKENSYAQIVEVTKRDGKSFEGQWRGTSDKPVVLDFEGEVDGRGSMTITFTKIVNAPEEWRKSTGRNILGVRSRGKVGGKSVTLRSVWPDPDHPKGTPTIITTKLKLKE
jgi:hypothetical protein